MSGPAPCVCEAVAPRCAMKACLGGPGAGRACVVARIPEAVEENSRSRDPAALVVRSAGGRRGTAWAPKWTSRVNAELLRGRCMGMAYAARS